MQSYWKMTKLRKNLKQVPLCFICIDRALLHFLHYYQDPNVDCVPCWTPLLHWEGQSYSFFVEHPIEDFLGEMVWVTMHTQKWSRVHGLATSRFSDGLKSLGECGYTTERSVEELWIYTKEFKIYLCTQSTTVLEIYLACRRCIVLLM